MSSAKFISTYIQIYLKTDNSVQFYWRAIFFIVRLEGAERARSRLAHRTFFGLFSVVSGQNVECHKVPTESCSQSALVKIES